MAALTAEVPTGYRIARNRVLEDAGLGSRADNIWASPFFFVQFADPQLGGDAKFVLQDTSKGWEIEEAMLAVAIDEINRLGPAFAIICGDMVEEATTPEYDQERRVQQVESFKTQCARIDPSIPLLCVCGNHDVGDRPNGANVGAYVKDFGDDYFAFWVGGLKGIVINTQLWPRAKIAPLDAEAETMRRQQEEWLEAVRWLARSRTCDFLRTGLSLPLLTHTCLLIVTLTHPPPQELKAADTKLAKHVLVFAHIAPFHDLEDEEDDKFNLTQDVRAWLIKLLVDHHVAAVFCGHWHRNGGAFTKSEKLEVVVTGPISFFNGLAEGVISPSLDNSGVRLVRLGSKAVRHRWYSLRELQQLQSLATVATEEWCQACDSE